MTSAEQHSANACSEGPTEAIAGALRRLELAAQLAAPAVARLTDDERAAVLHVLATVADATERRSDQGVREAAASARDALVARVPADWS